jgi:hypothetical protein
MIKLIIDLLQINPYYGVSKKMNIAKGKNAIPKTWKGLWENIKRRLWPIRK